MGAAVIACGDASPVLELGEHVLDLVALAVERPVVRDRYFAVGFDGMQGTMPRLARALRNQPAS